jgi:4-amino-4-deoxy-L-arabinose transferase-like glycosyltransferase
MIGPLHAAADPRPAWRPLAAILLLVAPLYVFGTFNHDLWRPAEAREAGIAREMIENGNWVATHLRGQLFLEKPPLYTWTLAAPLLLFGWQDWAVRLPVLAFTLGTLALVFPYARRRLGALGAQAAVAALATMELFLEVNHGAMIDNGLAFFILLALLALDRLREPEAPRSPAWAVVFYAAMAAAFLCKGLVGPVLILAAAGGYLLLSRDWRFLVRLRPGLGLLVLAVLVGPYLIALWRRGGAEYFQVLFVANHLRRFTGAEGPVGGLFHYVPYLAVVTAPWCLLLPPALWAVRRRIARAGAAARAAWQLDLAWFAGMFAILSIAGSKDNQYLLPLLPPVAVLAGAWVEESAVHPDPPRWTLILTWLFGLTVLAVLAFLPWTPAWTGRNVGVGSLAASMLLAALAGWALLALARGRISAWWRRLAWLPVFAGLGLALFVEGPFNDRKSMRPLSDALERLYVREHRLVAYDLGENTLGALIFYGWRPVETQSGAQLDAWGRAPEPALIVVQTRDGLHPIVDILLASRQWRPAGSARVGDRTFLFLYNRAAGRSAPASFTPERSPAP